LADWRIRDATAEVVSCSAAVVDTVLAATYHPMSNIVLIRTG